MNKKNRMFKKTVAVICLLIMLLLPLSISANATSAPKNKAIVIIPGIAGSELKNSGGQKVWLHLTRLNQLACTETGSSINTINPITENYGVLNGCKKLYNELKNAYGNLYDIIYFPYDWRMSCATAAGKLAERINSYQNIILVAHSMGGLVASKYLMTPSNRSKVSKFISLGTPYTGSAKALKMMETGDFVVAIDNILGLEPTLKALVCNFPAVYELLPTYRSFYGSPGTASYAGYITDSTSGYIYDGNRILSTHAESMSYMRSRSWGKKSNGTDKPMFTQAVSFHYNLMINGNHIANDSSKVDTYKIYGTGKNTIYRVKYRTNGTISSYLSTNAGDGTVIIHSATNGTGPQGNKVYGFSCSHTGLTTNDSVISKVKAIIAGTASINSFGDEVLPQSINEKGWVVGQDNVRINILAYNVSNINIYTDNGEEIFRDNDYLYYKEAGGDIVEVGNVWSLGDNSYQLVLNNGKYKVNIEKNQFKNSELLIEYMDSGYYTKSVTYKNIDNVRITVDDSATKSIKCYNNNTLLIPSKVMSQQELDLLNR